MVFGEPMTEMMLSDGGGVGDVAGFALKYQHPIVIAFVEIGRAHV